MERESDLDDFIVDLKDAYSRDSESLDLQLLLTDISIAAELDSREGRSAIIQIETLSGQQWTVPVPEDSSPDGDSSSSTIPISLEMGDGTVEIATMEVILYG